MYPSALAKIPRRKLAQAPTPIQRIDSGWPGGRLFVKRDDLTGCGLGGNKVRKLEYLVADARRRGADTLVTCGGIQSNCARALAVAAAMTGFRSALLLTGSRPGDLNGNLLIDHLVGSDVQVCPATTAAARDAALAELGERLVRAGRRPYLVPFGGSSEVGTLGYVRAGLEIARQLDRRRHRIRHVVMPMASGGTFAGLFIGFQLAGLRVDVVGAYVEGRGEDWTPTLLELVRGMSRRFDLDARIGPRDVHLIDARGEGYAQPSTEELAYIAAFARSTGLLLDPVYTGKALCALDREIRLGRFEVEGDVLFIHTGGVFGIFPYNHRWPQVLGRENGTAEPGAWENVQAPVRVASM